MFATIHECKHMCKFICINIFICSCMHAHGHIIPAAYMQTFVQKWSWVLVLVHIFLTKLWCVHRCEHTILIASMWTRITWKYSIIQICIHRYSSICVYVPCVNSFVHIHGCRLRMHKSMFPYIHASMCAWVLMHVMVCDCIDEQANIHPPMHLHMHRSVYAWVHTYTHATRNECMLMNKSTCVHVLMCACMHIFVW